MKVILKKEIKSGPYVLQKGEKCVCYKHKGVYYVYLNGLIKYNISRDYFDICFEEEHKQKLEEEKQKSLEKEEEKNIIKENF